MSIATKRAIITIFLLIVAAALAGCNSGEQAGDEELPEYVYVSQYIPLPRDLGNISNIAYFDNKIYFVASEDKEIITVHPDSGQGIVRYKMSAVYSVDMDGTGLSELTGIFPADIPADADKSSEISLTVDDDGNIWIYTNWSYYAPGYSAYIDGGFNIRKLDPAAGTELLSIDVRSYFANLILAYNDIPQITIQSAADGELIFMSTGDFRTNSLSVRIFDTEGKMLIIDAFNQAAQLIKMPDGTVAVIDSDGVMYTPDISSGKFARNNDSPLAGMLEASDISLDAGVRFVGGGGFDMLVSDNNSLTGIEIDKREMTRLLGWRENSVGIENVREIITIPDGRIVCLYTRLVDAYSEKAVLIILEKTLRSELSGITELTLAGAGITDSELIDAVYDFNAANREYQIKVVDYLQSDMDAAITQLNLDIIAGKVPDILFTENLPYIAYARSGLFADLYPFIDADPDYGRDDFIQGALRAAEHDGKLYRVFSGFWLNSIIGSPAVVGDGSGWTLDEFEAVLDAHPAADIPIGEYSSSDFLRNGARSGY